MACGNPGGLQSPATGNSVSTQWLFVRYRAKVPAHTEAKIKQLCAEALAAKTEADVERILPELREALREHVQLAKSALEGQLSVLAAIDKG